ncbi:MAG: hypothetical protein ACLURV_14445 [Gallintestinimicrobium sp.]
MIRYEGPHRHAGMLMTTEAIVCDHRLNGHVSLIPTGFPAPQGAAIGHHSPEAASGPIAYVKARIFWV